MTPRFVVTETHGFLSIIGQSFRGPGLTAKVLDSLNGYRVVAQYRTEGEQNINGSRLGTEGAREAARDKAAELNRDYC